MYGDCDRTKQYRHLIQVDSYGMLDLPFRRRHGRWWTHDCAIHWTSHSTHVFSQLTYVVRQRQIRYRTHGPDDLTKGEQQD
jgi:hypothetical protein